MAVDPQAAVNAQNQNIGNAYAQLQQKLQAGVGATGNIFGQAQSNVGGAYDQGLSAIQGYTQTLQDRLNRGAKALGIGGASSAAQEGLLGTLLANSAGMTDRKTNALAALGRQGADYQAIGTMAVGDAARQGEQAKNDYGSKLQKALYEYMGKDEEAKARVDLQKLANQAAVASNNAKLAASKAQADASIKQAQVNAQSRANEMAYRQQLASQKDPMQELEAAYKAMQIEKLQKDIESSPEDKAKPMGKGQLGLQEFYQRYGITPDTNEAKAIQNIIETTTNKSNEFMQQGRPFDEYVIAKSMLGGFDDNYDKDLIDAALGLYYGKSSGENPIDFSGRAKKSGNPLAGVNWKLINGMGRVGGGSSELPFFSL